MVLHFNVPFLPISTIEAEAAQLLGAYAEARGRVVEPPIPVDEILEHLNLPMEVEDLGRKFGFPDALGATSFSERRVYVHEALDPEVHPWMLGRYRFTVAHEIGHWQLHRRYAEAEMAQISLFDPPDGPEIICRSSEAKEPKEWQADAFAGCLLMPRGEVMARWRHEGPLRAADLWPGWKGLSRSEQDEVVELEIRPLATLFEVSPVAMRIRLEGLGLVVREGEQAASLFGDG